MLKLKLNSKKKNKEKRNKKKTASFQFGEGALVNSGCLHKSHQIFSFHQAPPLSGNTWQFSFVNFFFLLLFLSLSLGPEQLLQASAF